MNSQLRIRLQDDFLLDRFLIHIQDLSAKYDDRSIAIVTNLVVTKVDPYQTLPRDMENLSIQRGQAVELMNDLWNAGVRPTHFKGENNAESLALKAHIADLRFVIQKLIDAKTIAGTGSIVWNPDPVGGR